jgi:GTP-binding protein LepA
VVIDFHDQLKNITAGYGSLDTSEADPPLAEGALSKVDIMLNGEVVEPLAFVCHRDNAQGEARKVAQKLQGVLPRQQFVTAIQAKADGKIIASERIKACKSGLVNWYSLFRLATHCHTLVCFLLAQSSEGRVDEKR